MVRRGLRIPTRGKEEGRPSPACSGANGNNFCRTGAREISVARLDPPPRSIGPSVANRERRGPMDNGTPFGGISVRSFGELKRNLRTDASSLPKVRVGLLGDTATQFLGIALRGMGVERGFNVELFEAEYNQIAQEVENLESDLHQFSPEIVILFQSTHKLLNEFGEASPENRAHLAEKRMEFIQFAIERMNSKVICFNYPEIDDGVFGNFSNRTDSSFVYQVRKLNFELMQFAKSAVNFSVCDLASIQNKHGRNYLFNPAVYTTTDSIFALDAIPFVASRTWDMIEAMRGKFKKCLILDLDNTLWGGVIGDDGLERIQIGHGLGIGKAFSEFQVWVKKLKQRGILLAVCSKNTESIAKEPFEKHPDMVLRLDDFAVFVANWENKVDNIRKIQQILNIGFDSMVFLDDNPFERNMVRSAIPEITVPELPEDPAEYLEFLYGENLFETSSISSEDGDRTRKYQEEANRVSLRMNYTEESEYLKNLAMVSQIQKIDSFNIPRVAQLSQRSNQFNLRTIRYTDSDVERLEGDKRYHCRCFTLSDKFGDHGLIAVIFLEILNPKSIFVDTWLMSCRVLKRGMEVFCLNFIVDYARAEGFEEVISEFRRTAKNALVEEHYDKLGFQVMEANSENKRYRLDVSTFQNKTCFIAGEGVEP